MPELSFLPCIYSITTFTLGSPTDWGRGRDNGLLFNFNLNRPIAAIFSERENFYFFPEINFEKFPTFAQKLGNDSFFYYENLKYKILYDVNDRFLQNGLPFLHLCNEKTQKNYLLIPTKIVLPEQHIGPMSFIYRSKNEEEKSKLCLIECKNADDAYPNPNNNFHSYVLIHCFVERKMYLDALKIALPVSPTLRELTSEEIEVLEQIALCSHRDPEARFFKTYAAIILDTNNTSYILNKKGCKTADTFIFDSRKIYSDFEAVSGLLPACFTAISQSLNIDHDNANLRKMFLLSEGVIQNLSEEVVMPYPSKDHINEVADSYNVLIENIMQDREPANYVQSCTAALISKLSNILKESEKMRTL